MNMLFFLVPCKQASGYGNLEDSVKPIIRRAHFRGIIHETLHHRQIQCSSWLDENFNAPANGFNLAHIYPEEKISTHLYDYVLGGDMNKLQ